MSTRLDATSSLPVQGDGGATAPLLLSSYDWESDKESITLADAIQRFRDVNGYVGLPIPAKPHFLKLFRKLINGSREPERIYLVHDASHVLTGTTFTHGEPSLVLLAGEAAEQGLYFASRGVPKALGWVLFYGGAFVECARRIAPFGQVWRGIQLGIFNRAYEYARRTALTNLFNIPVEELSGVSVAEARRRLGIPEGGIAVELYREISFSDATAEALRREWMRYGISR
ncbi:MAG TPA: hypothetical protein VFX42_11500 [Gemmatimonadales bacterium]|nr:hypothetical protein [Gemmatimonadales bacterium]